MRRRMKSGRARVLHPINLSQRAAPVGARSRSEVAFQLPREVRLRGEPGSEGDVGDRPIRAGELARGVVHAQAAQVRAECDPEAPGEGAAEMNGMAAARAIRSRVSLSRKCACK